MSLTQILEAKGCNELEGYSQQIPQQICDLQRIVGTAPIRIMEIGFNAGHSAEIFLKHNPHATVTSFDLGMHEYVSYGKEYIDLHYPGRHTLILGDSKVTIPAYIKKHQSAPYAPLVPFDVIFIDGDHEYNGAREDMDNCFHLAHKNTVVILDDTMYKENWRAPWTLGPTQVWTEDMVSKRCITLGTADYVPGRGMTWGTYA